MKIWVKLLWVMCVVTRSDAGYRRDAFQDAWPGEFPCREPETWRSEFPPESVHRLRPGDVDVVAAIGDSHTAGNAALSDNLYEAIFRENRGVTWSMGGQGNWSHILTVPNILKVMNPRLVGYSLGDGHPYSAQAQFNAAFNGAMDQDVMGQARWLVDRMRKDPRVDFDNHWKLVTVMIGTNDICSDQCYRRDEGVAAHRRNLVRLLDFLYASLPRAFINLVAMPYIPFYADLVDPPFPTCIAMQLIACSCLFGGASPALKLSNVVNVTRAFQAVQEDVAESDRYDLREDFAVVYQPTHRDSRFPKIAELSDSVDPHDYSYVGIDCIHFTQKLHAVLANAYWNNLFEEPGRKTSTWDTPPYRRFLCPTRERPYLLTNRNRWFLRRLPTPSLPKNLF